MSSLRIPTFLFCFSFFSVQAQQSQNVLMLGNWTDTSVHVHNDARFNEVWGFVEKDTEYGVIGSTEGTHIISLGPDNEMELVDFVPGAFQGAVVHRDFHDYNGYLYGICQQGSSTLQIMDITTLPDSVSVVYDSNALFSIAHNIFIDSATAKLYVCGPPGHAMSVYSLLDPTQPTLLSHFDGVNYVHDIYVRNDTAFLNAANQGLFVYVFDNPASPQLIGSLTTYPDQGYNHSGWWSKDAKTYVFADETSGKKMKVCDVEDLSDIQVLSLFNSGETEGTIPHNLILKDEYVYVSHYNDGLQIFNISDRLNPVREAYYDTYPQSSGSNFKGAWGVYPLLPSERILISDRQSGLFLFKFNLPRIQITSSDTTICFGDSILIAATVQDGTPPYSYFWSDGTIDGPTQQLSSSIFANMEASYWVVVMDSAGLVTTDTIDVQLYSPLQAPEVTQMGFTLSSTAAFSYQWYFEGDPIAGATDQTYTAEENGTYWVEITDENGCMAVSENIVVVGVGFADPVELQEDIKLLSLDNRNYELVAANHSGALNLQLSNIEGKVLFQDVIVGNSYSINLAGYAAGFYILSLDGEQIHWQQKLLAR